MPGTGRWSGQTSVVLSPTDCKPEEGRCAPHSGTSAGFCLGGSMPPCLRRRKFDYEMVHSEVYLNKYVVSIAPFITPACPECSQNII